MHTFCLKFTVTYSKHVQGCFSMAPITGNPPVVAVFLYMVTELTDWEFFLTPFIGTLLTYIRAL